jgi:hypothetical protein
MCTDNTVDKTQIFNAKADCTYTRTDNIALNFFLLN